MSATFPDHPYLTGYFAPSGVEHDAADLKIEGRIPSGLAGTFYRNGPDPQFAPHPDDTYHPFDGDGMIYAFTLGGGTASLRSRWIRTPKFLAERTAGKRLYGVFNNPRFNDPAADPAKYDTANTHIWPHAGRLFALMEGCPPTELNPETLDTLGYETFDGQAAGPFTAHPKLDPVTGELFGFGWGAKGPGSTAVRYNVIAANGRRATAQWLEQPYCSMMHDFALTENFVVFPCLPLTISMARAMAGKPAAAWESDKPAYFGIMPRYGDTSEIRWIETDPVFAFHVAGAQERPDGEIVIEVAGSKQAPLMPDAEGRLPNADISRLSLRRWIIGANRTSVREEIIDDMGMQFPRIDDRFNGRRYSHVYFNGSANPASTRMDGFDTIAAYDLTNDRRAAHTVEGGYFGEPVFVAASDDAGSEGYVLATLYRPDRDESSLEIFDAFNIADGPVARIIAPARIPGGFHCSWRPQIGHAQIHHT